MTHFLDTLPFDLSSQPARELWAFLSDTYYREPQVEVLLRQAGIKPATINWAGSMELTWADILITSRNQGLLRPLLQVIASGTDVAVAARVQEWLGPEPPTNAPPSSAGEPDWKGFTGGAGFERQILAEPTLLDVAFLRRGTELAAGVCRLLVTTEDSKKFVGTGFRIAENLLLSNHHVIFDRSHGNARPVAVEAWFGYERAFDGADLQHDVVHGLPESARGGLDHDWAVIELDSPMPEGTPIISLTAQSTPRPGDRVYIIQHPNGGPKQIGMIHNEVRYVDQDVLQYWTDTAAGSSGSPVFDEQWQLVALHHRYVKHQADGGTEYRNQGRRIERVAEALAAADLVHA